MDRWRKLFADVTAQLDELDGKAAQVVDNENRTQTQTHSPPPSPAMDFTVEAGKVTFTYQNVNEFRVNYYLMDIELLFSQNPFVQQYTRPLRLHQAER